MDQLLARCHADPEAHAALLRRARTHPAELFAAIAASLTTTTLRLLILFLSQNPFSTHTSSTTNILPALINSLISTETITGTETGTSETSTGTETKTIEEAETKTKTSEETNQTNPETETIQESNPETKQSKQQQSSKLTIDALLLILPRRAAAIPTHLPELFLAFATTLLAHPPPPQEPDPVDAHCSLSAAITSLFGFLYGLAPCNFLAFLRSPTDALQAFRPDTPGPALDALLHRAARIPLDSLHALVLPIIDQHRLAPHILRPDPAAERKELAHRLRLCEPAEILETCQRTRIQAPCPSPPIPAPSPATDTQATDQQATEAQAADGQLADQNRLLRTQLHVELYLRSQHLQQLGSVHKQHIGGAGLEAENQNLLRMNKELRKKLALNLGARPDAQAASAADQRNKAVYHALIKARNAKLKEDNLALISTRAALRGQLAEQAKVVAIQAANLAAVHAEAHELRNRLALQAPQLRVLAGLELQTARLARALLVWDDDLRRIRAAAGRVDALRASWKQAASAAASLETEAARLRAALQSQQTRIAALEAANAALSARAAVSQRQAGRDPAVARLAALVDRYRALNAALTRRIVDAEAAAAGAAAETPDGQARGRDDAKDAPGLDTPPHLDTQPDPAHPSSSSAAPAASTAASSSAAASEPDEAAA